MSPMLRKFHSSLSGSLSPGHRYSFIAKASHIRCNHLVQSLSGKARRLFHTLRLQEVATFVAGDELQSGSGRETKDREERIPKQDVVHIVVASVANEFAGGLVAS